MIYQTDRRLLSEIQSDGCLFLCLCLAKERLKDYVWSAEELNEAWLRLKDEKIINPETLLVQDYPGLCEELGLPIRFIPQDSLGIPLNLNGWPLPTKLSLDASKFFVIERWTWRMSHFVKNDGTGHKPVEWDPIEYGSRTVKFGAVSDLRIFEVLKGG